MTASLILSLLSNHHSRIKIPRRNKLGVLYTCMLTVLRLSNLRIANFVMKFWKLINDLVLGQQYCMHKKSSTQDSCVETFNPNLYWTNKCKSKIWQWNQIIQIIGYISWLNGSLVGVRMFAAACNSLTNMHSTEKIALKRDILFTGQEVCMGKTVPEDVLSTIWGPRPWADSRQLAQFFPILTDLGWQIMYLHFSYFIWSLWNLGVLGKVFCKKGSCVPVLYLVLFKVVITTEIKLPKKEVKI